MKKTLFKKRGMSSLEKSVLKKLKKTKEVAHVTYETHVFPYTIRKKYVCDFTITTRSGKTIYLETKGWFRPEDRTKMRAVKEGNPGIDIRFLFPSNNKLNKNSSMRYSDWCEKYGFTYCIGDRIPTSWLRVGD